MTPDPEDALEDADSPTPGSGSEESRSSAREAGDGDNWLTAENDFFERHPEIHFADDLHLTDQVREGKKTVATLREEYAQAVQQYDELQHVFDVASEALLTSVPPTCEEFLSWDPTTRNAYEQALFEEIAESQYAHWLTKMVVRFGSLTELMLTYQRVATAEGIALQVPHVDDAEEAAK